MVINRKREKNGENILNYLDNDKKNVIFGAGSIASLLKDALDNLGVEIEYFLVNDGHKESEYYKGIKVYELCDLEDQQLQKVNILYSIQSDSKNISEKLESKTSNNILFLGGMEAIFNLLYIYYKRYMIEKNIDIENDIIEFKGIKMINPFKLDKDYLNAFLFEIGDLILPNVLGDYSKINEGPYEDGKVLLSEGDIVIDCGANVGIFSAISAFKGCKCYAFEPVPETEVYLKKMSELYDGLIEVCGYALSDFVGTSKLYITEDTNISNSILGINQEKTNYIEVPVTTIDGFVKKNNLNRVDFIKADIEGAERDMLKGAKETLSKFAPKISICTYHLKDDPEVLENLIKSANSNYIIEHKWKKIYAYVPVK